MASNYNFQTASAQPQHFNVPAQQQIQNLNQNSILFPQPIGSVYNLNTANEIGNIPTGMNVSLGLCLSEGILYIKSLQNGSPMLLGYKLLPLGGIEDEDSSEDKDKLNNILNSFENRFNELEKQLVKIKNNIGSKKEWQI